MLYGCYKTAGLKKPEINGTWVQFINNHTLIIQEFFQEKVKIWLDTVGKQVFRMSHYWLCFEFAPSREQIHAHILIIYNYSKIYEIAYTHHDDKAVKAEIINMWVENGLGMTCNLSTKYNKYTTKDFDNHPSSLYLIDVKNMELDQTHCQLFLQHHYCSSYCLKKKNKIPKKGKD